MAENRSPLSLKENRGFYSVVLSDRLALEMGLERSPVGEFHVQWRALAEVFAGPGGFTASEARARLNIPRTSLQRLLNWAIERGHVARVGQSKSARYLLIQSAAGHSDPVAA